MVWHLSGVKPLPRPILFVLDLLRHMMGHNKLNVYIFALLQSTNPVINSWDVLNIEMWFYCFKKNLEGPGHK